MSATTAARRAAIIAHSCELLDRAERAEAGRDAEREWQETWADRMPTGGGRELRAWLHEMPVSQRPPEREEVVYRALDPALRHDEPERQHGRAAMNQDWDAYVDSRIRQKLEDFAGMLGAEVGSGEQALRAEIDKLKIEVAELRGELLAARTKRSCRASWAIVMQTSSTDPFAFTRRVQALIDAVRDWRERGSVAIGLLVAAERLVEDDEFARVAFAQQLIAAAQKLDPDARRNERLQ